MHGPLYPEKARSPISVICGSFPQKIKASHSLKAFVPIFVTLLGMVIEVKSLQPEKASEDISFVSLLIMQDVMAPLFNPVRTPYKIAA